MRLPFTPLGGAPLALAGFLPLLAGSLLLFADRPAAAVPLLLVASFTLWFFRDPERRLPDDEGVLVSAADGKVVVVDEVDEPDFVGGRALRVGVFLSVFDVHVNRAPGAGVVEWLRHTPGRFLDARDPRSRTENEAQAIGLRLDDGTRVLVRQVAGLIARRILCPLSEGQRLERGERIGMIRFGSYTEVLVPADAGYAAATAVGEKVRGAASVLFVRGARPAGADSVESDRCA